MRQNEGRSHIQWRITYSWLGVRWIASWVFDLVPYRIAANLVSRLFLLDDDALSVDGLLVVVVATKSLRLVFLGGTGALFAVTGVVFVFVVALLLLVFLAASVHVWPWWATVRIVLQSPSYKLAPHQTMCSNQNWKAGTYRWDIEKLSYDDSRSSSNRIFPQQLQIGTLMYRAEDLQVVLENLRNHHHFRQRRSPWLTDTSNRILGSFESFHLIKDGYDIL